MLNAITARTRQPARALLAALALTIAAVPAHAALPDDFADEPVASGLNQPASLAFLPDGRALVVELNTGAIQQVHGGTVQSVGTVPGVRTGGERGLLGVAVDPRWPAHPYVYVHSCWDQAFEIRVSRFALAGDLDGTGNGALTLDVASRHEVLTGLTDNLSIHNGGTLRFGPDSLLYVSLGEDAEPCEAQRPEALLGAILRLDVRGIPAGAGGPPPRASLAPAGNPFPGTPDAELVWAYGLRNPFRFSVDPEAGHLYVADVGQNAWEEINEVKAGGANLGWPWYEGYQAYDACAGDSTATQAPVHVYDHDRPGQEAVIGGPLYRRGAATAPFPAEYEGDLFFSDYYKGDLVRLEQTAGVWSVAPPVPGQPSPAWWGTGYSFVADWAVHPDGALWYVKQSTGEVRRIRAIPPSGGVADHPRRDPPRDGLYDLQGRRVDRGAAERGGIYFTPGRRRIVLP